MEVTVRLSQGAEGVRSLAQRAQGLNARALVRTRQLPGGVVEAFVTTPFDVLASRRAQGRTSVDAGALVVADFLATGSGPNAQASWPGALPPAEGFSLIDEVPAEVALPLSTEGHNLARQFSGPAGPPRSLLDQTVLTVSGNDQEAHIPMRMIFACTSLGLIPGFAAPTSVPRYLRVSACGRWVRIDAAFGTVYRSSGLSLLF